MTDKTRTSAADEWTFYVIRHLNGRFVAQDKASGGYPYLVSGLRQAHLYESFEQAFRYKGVFHGGQFDSDKWRIIRCEVHPMTISLDSYVAEADSGKDGS